MSEQILGILPAIMTGGWKGDLHCNLVFTPQRIVVSIKGLLAQATASGIFGATGGTVGGAIGWAAATAGEKKARPGLNQSPEELLQSNKKNFQVSYSQIIKVEVGKKLGTSRLYIHTAEEAYKFKFQGIRLEQVEASIRSVLPATVAVHMSDKLD